MERNARCIFLNLGNPNHSYVFQQSVKVKVTPQQAEVAQGVPGRLRPRILVTFGTTRVVGHQPYAPAAFTTGEITAVSREVISPTV